MAYNISLRDDPPVCKECEALREQVKDYKENSALFLQQRDAARAENERLRGFVEGLRDDVSNEGWLRKACQAALRMEETK